MLNAFYGTLVFHLSKVTYSIYKITIDFILYIKSYCEWYNSLIYLIRRYIFHVVILLIMILIFSMIAHNYIFILSLVILVAYDFFYVTLLIPIFKGILNITVKDKIIDKEFLFCMSYEKTEYKKSKSKKSKNEVYWLTYPLIAFDLKEVKKERLQDSNDSDNRESKKNNEFSKHKAIEDSDFIKFNNMMKNFIWLTKFYEQQGNIKYYIYPFLSIATHTIFFILMYKFYFIHTYHISNSMLVFLFLLVWLLYTIHSIEDILSLNYYKGYLNEFREIPRMRYFLKNLNIILVKDFKSQRVEIGYFITMMHRFIKYYDKKMEYMITFVATVIFIGLLTFMGFYKPAELTNSAKDKNRTGVYQINIKVSKYE